MMLLWERSKKECTAATYNQRWWFLQLSAAISLSFPPLSLTCFHSSIPSVLSAFLHLQPTLCQVLPSFSCPSIRLPATPPTNHFSWVGLIKGDLTECADHRNINQSLSNTASPRWLPQPAANVHNSAKVNCIHYIRDRVKEGEREGEKVKEY